MRAWASLRELFDSIPDDVSYLVLRNYEAFETEQLLDEHADIDVLCADVLRFASTVGAEPRTEKRDRAHYWLLIAGKPVSLDVRSPGDGYYDENWARALLDHRRLYQGAFYVPEPAAYFYSLLYHAVVHKRALSDEYRERLTAMAAELGIDIAQAPFYGVLNDYMRQNGYYYTYPSYPHGIANFAHADPALIHRQPGRMLKRFVAIHKRRIGKRLKGGLQHWAKR